jgi:hypothetical protein
VLGGKRATYVSGPITTGRAYVEWAAAASDDEAIPPSELRKANEVAIIRHAEKLRLSGRLVIEPASFGVPWWSQLDYHEFWIEVIRQYVCEMVVLDGWEYSLGCVLEFQAAIGAGVPVLDTNNSPVSDTLGRARMLSALEVLESKRSERLLAFAEKLRNAAG